MTISINQSSDSVIVMLRKFYFLYAPPVNDKLSLRFFKIREEKMN